MAMIRIQLETDRSTARRVQEMHLGGRAHRESRDAARAEAWRRGYTPSAEPVFVGVTNGDPVRLMYDVEVDVGTTH